MTSPIPVEQVYMLLGVKEAEIYLLKEQLNSLQRTIQGLVDELNEARQPISNKSHGQRESSGRLVDFKQPIESLETTIERVPETEGATEGL